jgi:hypothetical protein
MFNDFPAGVDLIPLRTLNQNTASNGDRMNREIFARTVDVITAFTGLP